MKKTFRVLLVLLIASLIACAQYGGYRPTVDPYGGYGQQRGYGQQQQYNARSNQQHGEQRHTIDTYGDQNAYRINQDMQECERLATQASGGGMTETMTGGLVGGLVGAAGGAALGAILGNPGTGAALGAAAGGIGGGAYNGMDSNSKYKLSYSNCMRNRGHNVIN